MKKILLLSIFLLSLLSINSQNAINQIDVLKMKYPHLNHEKCKADVLHQKLLQNNAQYASQFPSNELLMKNILNSAQPKSGGIYTIPVVVHVMHLGEGIGVGTNISDAQIQSAIDNLNDAYRNVGYSGVDIGIEFSLAVRDPNCAATSGIVRVDASGVSDYAVNGITNDDGSSDNEAAVKALSNWPNDAYYNIWVVAEIDANDGGAGTQGYAYFPGAGPTVDGTVILYNSFGYDPNHPALGFNLKSYTKYNATTIHELGHGLGLYHTFQGYDSNNDGVADQCPANGNPSDDGDECADTDAHKRDDEDCDAIANTCHGVANSSVYNNFMAYSADECQDRFTANQKARMVATMEGTRKSLTTSLALTPAPTSAPSTVAVNCSPVSDPAGLSGGFGGIMDVTFGNRTVSTSNTENYGINYGTNGYLDFSEECLYYDEFDEGETFDVSVVTWFNDHNVKVYVDWDNSGTFDAGEEELSLNIIGNNNGGNNTGNGQITIPAGAVTSQYLRLRFNADIGAVGSACEALFRGQVEDYSTYINAVSTAPTADFTVNDATPCQGVAAAFTDASIDNPTSWSWDFGDGFVSSSQNPSHTYANAGNYTVTLTATNAAGSDDEVKAAFISVMASEDASFSYSNSNYCTSDVDPTPTITGTGGGSFTSTPVG